MKIRRPIVAAVLAVMLILPGCKSASNVVDQASGLMSLANGMPEISQFMGLAQLGGLAGMLGGGASTLLAPSNDALGALGEEALGQLSSPEGADDLKNMLMNSFVPGSVSAADLTDKLGGANVLRTEESEAGVVHVLDSLLPG